MADWQRRIDLNDVWASKDVPLIAKALSERLRALKPLGDERLDYEREDLAEQFASLAADPTVEVDEFDSVMEELYNWADTPLDHEYPHCQKKVCWIKTFW